MTDTQKSPRRRIRYAVGAGGGDEEPGELSVASTRAPWRDSADNPMSQNYVPPEQRSPRGKARWWAMQQKRKKDKLPVQFDIGPKEW